MRPSARTTRVLTAPMRAAKVDLVDQGKRRLLVRHGYVGAGKAHMGRAARPGRDRSGWTGKGR